MKKQVMVTALILLFISPVFSYNEKPPIKWGQVTKSEFSIKSFRGDSSVDAIILCDYGDIKITNRTFYTRHTRIKILNSEGYKYANIEVPYRARNDHDDIIMLKARTYNMENGKIVESKLRSGKFTDVKIDDQWRKKIFELPDVKEGSIIEYYYTIASLDFIKLDDWYFQSTIPALWSEIRIDIPEHFIYLVSYQKGKHLSNEQEIVFGKRLEWLYNTKRLKRRIELAKNNQILYESDDKNYKVYVMNNYKKKIIMKNLPGVKHAEGFLSVKDYYPKLRFHLFESSGRLPWIYQSLLLTVEEDYEVKSKWELRHSGRQSGYIHYQLDTWQEMNEKILGSERFGMQLIKHFDYKPVNDSILKDRNAPKERMTAIYDFVSQSMEWNGKYTVYLDKGINEPFNNRKGTSSEINMLMIYLLRRAGLSADPVLLRTNNLGMPETVYPVHNQFNHVIALVRIEEEMYLLDAIDSSRPYNILPEKDLFTRGWIVDSKDFGWINVNAD